MDAGNDSADNIQVCLKEGAGWLIKRNLRRESLEDWLETAQKCGMAERPREGKVIYRGETWSKREGIKEELRQVFEVTVRTIDAKGQGLLFPQIEAEVYETSLSLAPAQAIEVYHARGTCEQFHSEIKTDMDLERLPSGKFATNALVLLLGMLAYNGLRLCGQEALREEENLPPQERAPIRKKVQRRRLRSVMQDLIYMAGSAPCAADRAVLWTAKSLVWSMAADLSALYARNWPSKRLEYGVAAVGRRRIDEEK
jgi:hypothetical protein